MESVEIYYQVHQADERIENFHLSVNNVDIYLDLINDIKGRCISITEITKHQFDEQAPKEVIKVDLQDLYTEDDPHGDCVGYLEHYEI